MLEEADSTKITLAGKEFSIPPLSLRIQIKIVPRLIALGGIIPSKITEEDFADMVEIIFIACSAGDPSLKKEDFLEMSPTIKQIRAAFPVITVQAGLGALNASAGGGVLGEDGSPTSTG